MALDQVGGEAHLRADRGRRAGLRLFVLSRHAGLLRRREASGPFSGSAHLARRLWRSAHLRRLDGRRGAGARLSARQRAALPNGDPAPRRSGAHRRNPRRRSSRRRQVHSHPRLLSRGREQFFRAIALGAGAAHGLCRRRQRLPRQPQGRAPARVPARRRSARALEARRFAGLGQAFVASALP